MKFKRNYAALIMSLLVAFTFVSCGGDDDTEATNELVGTWDRSRVEKTNCTDAADNGVESSTCTAALCTSIVMRGDGTLTTIDKLDSVEDSEEGTYVISGNTVTMTIDAEITVLTFSVSGNALTLVTQENGCTSTTVLTKR